MARVIAVPPIPGVKDLFTLLEFMRDKDEFSKQLKALEDARVELNQLVEAVGKAETIQSLEAQAASKFSEAQAVLDKAKREALAIMQEARQVSVESEDKVRAIEDEMESKRRELETTMKVSISNLEMREAEVRAALKRAEDAEFTAQAKLNRATELEALFASKLAKLRDAGVV